MLISGSGKVSLHSVLHLSEMTTHQIVSLPSPQEGDIANDATIHTPVIYDGKSWRPILLGLPISR